MYKLIFMFTWYETLQCLINSTQFEILQSLFTFITIN
jgi:hypothetical protein